MRSVLTIISYTFLQQFRNRLYLVVVFFGCVLLAVSLLFGAVAADQEVRVILDLGLAMTEFFGLLTAIFGAVTLVLEEMESRTIYLILTRPLPRGYYILGRFLGLLSAVAASMLLMGVLHLLLLGLKGWEWDFRYFVCYPPMFFKVMVISSLALFFSLFSSSAVSSVVFTFFFWVLGHFGPELKFLAQKNQNLPMTVGTKIFLFITPDLQMLNYRDFFHVPGLSAAHVLPG
ncbi:MAG TPA: ABC transporter permease subunit, partial [Elusimicrobiota bacterium]|nr:ABC transporter permease subunit [Elusimicrobiota bacterium]